MAIVSRGVTYYRTTEAARYAGISRSTLLRWLSQGRVVLAERRDRNGWRVFSQEDIGAITAAAQQIDEVIEGLTSA